MLLDDDTLTALITSALDDVEPPPGAPGRILAARDGVPAAPRTDVAPPASEAGGASGWDGEPLASRTPRRRLVLVGVAAAIALLVAVVGGAVVAGGGRRASTTSSGPTAGVSMSAPEQQRSSAAGAASGAPALSPSSGAAQATPSGPAVPTAPGAARVVQTGALTLSVADGKVDAVVGSLGDVAAGLGGSVSRSQTSGTTADITLQVPSAAFDPLLRQVEALGTPSAISTSATDVTSTYVDLVARIDALEATRQQFLDILTKAQTISDILAVEDEITPLQTEIEQLQGQQQTLDAQTSTASLSVHVQEQAPPVVPPRPAASGLSKAWHHAAHSFASGMESVVGALGGIAVFAVCVAALGLVARIGWVVARRRLV